MNGKPVPEIEDRIARLSDPGDPPDGDVDALASRATRLTVEILDLAAEALRVRDQHAVQIDGLRDEVRALRREIDRLEGSPGPVEGMITDTGPAAWEKVRVGSVLSAPHGRGIVTERHADVHGSPWFTVEWISEAPCNVNRDDFTLRRVALVIGPRGRS
jgi:hypothetical protein